MGEKKTIKPITYMKTNAADILATVSETRDPIIITHNGEGKMVIQDIESYQTTIDALAMLKLAALGRQSVLRGRVQPARRAFEDIEKKRKTRRG
jgi:prevent-host-death family protein